MKGRCCARSNRVRVSVRFKPTTTFAHDIIQLDEDHKTVHVRCRHHYNHDGCAVQNPVHHWTFQTDAVLYNASQEKVYQKVVQDVVPRVMNGYSGTVMCYGQIGTGKTFTMSGVHHKYQDRGLVPRAVQQLFQEMHRQTNDRAINVRVSYLEVYNETLRDLLCLKPATDGRQLAVVDQGDTVHIKGLTYCAVQNEDEVLGLLFQGESARQSRDHSLNANSSRSHTIFTLHIQSSCVAESSATVTDSKLCLVDLAGSERIGKTRSTGQTQTETSYINKSLSCLEQCMMGLTDKERNYVPYRQSKLTHVLRDGLSGRGEVRLVLNVSGEGSQIEETLSSLRFAVRLMCVPCEPTVRDVCDPQKKVLQLQKQMSSLKDELAMHDTLAGRRKIQYEPLAHDEIADIRKQVLAYLQGDTESVDIVTLQQIRTVYQTFRDVYRQVENSVMNDIHEKYDLVPKAETSKPESEPFKQEKDKNMVGETDGKGYGIGEADAARKASVCPVVQTMKKNRQLLSKKRRDTGNNPELPMSGRRAKSFREMDTGPEKRASHMESVIHEVEEETKEKPDVNLPADKSVPSTEEALKQFRCGPQFALNQSLEKNKEIMKCKHDKYACSVRKVNDLKSQIDAKHDELELKQGERHLAGEKYDDTGNVIVSEAEKNAIQIIRELEEKYQKYYSELQSAKYEFSDIRKVVAEDQRIFMDKFQQYLLENYGSIPPDLPNAHSHKVSLTNKEMLKVVRTGVDVSQEERRYYQVRKKALQKAKKMK